VLSWRLWLEEHGVTQHQFYTLCQQRGWRYRVQGPFDSGGELGASRVLPRWGLRAEFWIDAVGGREEPMSQAGIFMEPNDQYLCIVPIRHDAQREGTARIFLPFEGDTTLSLILSKAFLLADDATITDPTIVHQIRSTGP
jgi:hypothetical protein